MNLKKKEKSKENFKEKDLFKMEETEENEEETEEINADDEENSTLQKIKKLNWKTDSNLYESAIQVKEINILM